MPVIEIDNASGFCHGVERSIRAAEMLLADGVNVYSLGHLVHNRKEIQRLKSMGMKVITSEQLGEANDGVVLIRAHGEPLSTYRCITENELELNDATCPILLRIQENIQKAWKETKSGGGTIIIHGDSKHPEVKALVSNAMGEAIVVKDASELAGRRVQKPVKLFSQTTASVESYKKLIQWVNQNAEPASGAAGDQVTVNNTICGQVAGRAAAIREFAARHDLMVFVSDALSANGKLLFKVCQESNPNSIFIEDPEELLPAMFEGAASIGITGATSTPIWLMEETALKIRDLIK